VNFSEKERSICSSTKKKSRYSGGT